jgi:DHA1 family tetracycline resistance protein-like MFS transporter
VRAMQLFSRLLPILGVTFVDILGFSIILPILPYFITHFGASDVVVGLLFSTFAGCQLLAGPIWGRVSDKIGRKSVLIVSQIGATIGWAMLAFAGNIFWVFVARIVEGVSGGNISVTNSYVADLVEPKQRTRAFAYVQAAFSAGIVFGPAFGGFLMKSFTQSHGAAAGFAAPFLAAAALQFVTLLLTIFMLPESRHRDKTQAISTLADVGHSLADKRIAPILWQMWAYSLALYGWFAIYSLMFKEALGFTPWQASYVFSGFGAFSVLLQIFVVGQISDRTSDRVCSNIGIACSVAGFACVPLIHSLPTMLPTMVFFAIGMALSRPGLNSLLTNAIPDDQRGVILGVGSSLDNVSGIVMPPISTSVLGRFGPGWSGVASLGCSAIALAIGLARQAREHAQASTATAGD